MYVLVMTWSSHSEHQPQGGRVCSRRFGPDRPDSDVLLGDLLVAAGEFAEETDDGLLWMVA